MARQQKDFTGQMHAVQNLSVMNRHNDNYELVEFSVEDWGKEVFVKRTRVPMHARSLSYSEAFVVGPRGAVRQLYSNFVY